MLIIYLDNSIPPTTKPRIFEHFMKLKLYKRILKHTIQTHHYAELVKYNISSRITRKILFLIFFLIFNKVLYFSDLWKSMAGGNFLITYKCVWRSNAHKSDFCQEIKNELYNCKSSASSRGNSTSSSSYLLCHYDFNQGCTYICQKSPECFKMSILIIKPVVKRKKIILQEIIDFSE